MAPEDEYAKRARKACLPCRRSKRRCDKKVPSCDLCIKKEVECSYPVRHKATDAKVRDGPAWSLSTPDASPLEYNSHNDEREQSSSIPSLGKADANAIQYIAPRIFRQARLELPRLSLPVPNDVSHLVGEASSIRDIAATFFRTIHRWYPIVSKQAFFTCLLNPLSQRRTELSLLALCMRLSCSTPSEADEENGNKTALYRVAKRYYHEVETAGVQSIHVLQAGILIAIYELGQAIYPAAYLTVGACARFGLGLGINNLSLASPGGIDERSWNEIEEKRRVWWAVLILDRFINLGDPARPLSTEDPTFDTYLPVDDAAWGDSTAKPGDAVRISNGFTLEMGSFARLAQATYLLSQALREIKTTSGEGNTPHDKDTTQLRRTLLALVHATDREVALRRLELCAQSVLSLSTILLLQEHHLEEDAGGDGNTTKPPLESLWPEARTALDRLSAAAISYNDACTGACALIPDASDHVPIFLMHVMYLVACILLSLSPATRDGEIGDKIAAIKQLLQLVNSRWRLAGVYLRILEAREITISSETIKARFEVITS